MQPNSFDKCQAIERRSLEILRPFICQRSLNGQYVIVEKGRLAKELQAHYGDVFMNRLTGGIASVEIKAEAENRHQNLFIEVWSNRSRFNLGWIYKINADVLLYHFIESDELFAMSLQELKRWLFWHKPGSHPNIYQYPLRVQKRHDQLNDTWGACVPIRSISSGLKSFKQFRASTGELTNVTPNVARMELARGLR